MEKVYVATIIAGIVVIIAFLLYLSLMPQGKVYTNAVILQIKQSQMNINSYGSYILNTSPNESVYLFPVYKTIFPLNTSDASIVLAPFNSSFYQMITENNTYLLPIINNTIIFSYFNENLEFFAFNKSVGFAYIINVSAPAPKSVYSTKTTTLEIFKTDVFSAHPIEISYTPKNASYYQNITLYCKSNTTFLYLTTNYGTKMSSNNGTIMANIKAYPDLTVGCYNGYDYIKKKLVFSPLLPKLNYSYKNGIITCYSSFPSVVYLYFENETLSVGMQNVSYNISKMRPPFTLTCVSPGNEYQNAVNLTIKITS